MDDQVRGRLQRLLQGIGRRIIQDVPAELDACELCRKSECSQDEWIVCEERIAHAKCLEAIQDKTES